jgi:2-amino-4-hydroxy-6-hydroxymethyldihydropteridine diphosphokinase
VSRAVIAVGANLGLRDATILSAVRELAGLDGVELVATSALVESVAVKPHGVDPDAPAYLNGVVIVETSLSPQDLLDRLREVEHAHGRERAERWGDRTLDLDIVDIDGQVIATDDLTLPHPRAAERLFVLEPWLDADPDAVLSGTPVAELADALRRVES